jgi:hypothetical protein
MATLIGGAGLNLYVMTGGSSRYSANVVVVETFRLRATFFTQCRQSEHISLRTEPASCLECNAWTRLSRYTNPVMFTALGHEPKA